MTRNAEAGWQPFRPAADVLSSAADVAAVEADREDLWVADLLVPVGRALLPREVNRFQSGSSVPTLRWFCPASLGPR
jgi:hypothetical protein